MTEAPWIKGSKNPNSKLTEDDVREIKRLLPTREMSWIAKKYGVHYGTIYQIKSGQTWKHVS